MVPSNELRSVSAPSVTHTGKDHCVFWGSGPLEVCPWIQTSSQSLKFKSRPHKDVTQGPSLLSQPTVLTAAEGGLHEDETKGQEGPLVTLALDFHVERPSRLQGHPSALVKARCRGRVREGGTGYGTACATENTRFRKQLNEMLPLGGCCAELLLCSISFNPLNAESHSVLSTGL